MLGVGAVMGREKKQVQARTGQERRSQAEAAAAAEVVVVSREGAQGREGE